MADLMVPDPSLVVLVGPSGAGKSTFASKQFRPTEIVSSDRCRALVSDDENDLRATSAAFRLLHAIARARLRFGRLTVIDATNVLPSARRPLIELARRLDREAVAIVLDLPVQVCLERNRARHDREVPPEVVLDQRHALTQSIEHLGNEGFHVIHMLDSPEALDAAKVVRA